MTAYADPGAVVTFRAVTCQFMIDMIQAFWGIASIAATLAGTIITWWKEPSQRRILLVTFLLVFAIVGTSEITVRIILYERTIQKVQSDIRKILVQQERTAEDIREELSLDPSLVNDALSRCLEDGTVGQKTALIPWSDNMLIKVRLYFIKSQTLNKD